MNCLYYGFNVIFNTGIMVLKLVLIEKHDEYSPIKLKRDRNRYIEHF